MEKINISELIKDCPTGMELDCTMFDAKVTYQGLSKRIPTHPIVVQTEHGFEFELTQYGQIHNIVGSRCVIFPKGKTTWEGFVPPCKFKDGDVCCIKTKEFEHICIFKISGDPYYIEAYAILANDNLYIDGYPVCDTNCVKEIRLATEEEKEKLFKVIKNLGYKWNAETKTLEELVEPQFKVGDKVREKGDEAAAFTISDIDDSCYYCGEYVICNICDQDEYEVVPNKFDVATLEAFDKVLVRSCNYQTWTVGMFSFYSKENIHPFACVGGYVSQCIPYEENKHLLGTTDDCDEFYKTWE
jgi:hypothetical protein